MSPAWKAWSYETATFDCTLPVIGPDALLNLNRYHAADMNREKPLRDVRIRAAAENDFAGMWPIFQAVGAPADTYVFSPAATREDAFDYWFGPGVASFVAESAGRIAGMYKLIPNQRDLGAHMANASFMVSPDERGRGIGEALGRHCLEEARKRGFAAMQFNFVVSTNAGAVALWGKLGFEIVGILPKAFRHGRLGEVDAYVMHRFLEAAPERS
jgi:ribosomal protein S18 acetylase RimI-like enzyme